MCDIESLLEKAEELYRKSDRANARTALEHIVMVGNPSATGAVNEEDARASSAAAMVITPDDTDAIRAKEQAVYRLTEIYTGDSDGNALIALLSTVRPFFSLLPKAKTTKLVRKLFSSIMRCGVPLERQEEVCMETIAWARQEKRTFLRHRIQLRLVEVLFERGEYRSALQSLISLLREVRRLDDRTLLLDIHLLESKIYYAIRNNSKARAALVSARTTANSIYCPPLAQAEIDLQSGVLHAEEHDPKTAYSYLYEAFQGFHAIDDQAKAARRALRYMVLAKIATDSPNELQVVLSSKSVLEYSGADLDALRGIAVAYEKQNTHSFNEILKKQQALLTQYKAMQAAQASEDKVATKTMQSAAIEGDVPLLGDEVVRRQLEDMYDTLMERHLLKLIAPYNRVHIDYLANLLQLESDGVEDRLSQLILDKKLVGIVDQQHRCLVLFDAPAEDSAVKEEEEAVARFYENAAEAKAANKVEETTLYQDALEALERYDALVTTLFDKVAGKFDALVEESLAKHQSASGSGSDKSNEKKDDETKKKKPEEKESGGKGKAGDKAHATDGDKKSQGRGADEKKR